MDGVLIIDKPTGPTSHDVVARARRALRETRIGHTGTLDPLATGVLPLVIGRATRLASFLSSGDKGYEGLVRLGSATASYDAAERLAAGEPPPPPPDVSRADIEEVLEAFRGTYLQAPPPYSAKKIGGIAAHRLARQNTPVQPVPVTVTVLDLALLGLEDGLARLRVTATAGFYVRSLAHDLGARLGCGAHLEALRRTRAGPFTLEEAVPLEIVEAEGTGAERRLIPLDALLPHLPAVRLNERGSRRASHGNAVALEDFESPDQGVAMAIGTPHVRLTSASGTLLGIASPAPGWVLRPTIVLV
ncbi:MAG TPA: tRNA pseudouridine(55) synthase TruB [Vicinamibacterales bacterium]|nr:tRNA pseudouridine(55) synthase TruB [Vicinamibacterales bacterium]